MVNTDILAQYYAGVIGLAKDVPAMQLTKGKELFITPAILYAVSSGKLPLDSFRLRLRKLEQLEDEEVVELSKIVLPNKARAIGPRRLVSRQGKSRSFTLEVSIAADQAIGRETSLVINKSCDIAISDIVYPPMGGRPVVTQLAAPNQVAAMRWLFQKQIDVYGLIDKDLARGRKVWTKSDYGAQG